MYYLTRGDKVIAEDLAEFSRVRHHISRKTNSAYQLRGQRLKVRLSFNSLIRRQCLPIQPNLTEVTIGSDMGIQAWLVTVDFDSTTFFGIKLLCVSFVLFFNEVHGEAG